jgi:hypothetical protein
MGWRGAIRSIEAAARRAERDARRQHNALVRQQKQYHKMLLREQAALEAQLYENRVELLTSMHKECGPVWDWKGIKESPAPAPPIQKHDREKNAQSTLDSFRPTFWDKIFRKVESKRKAFNDAIEDARATDGKEYLESVGRYQQEFEDWKEKRDIAERVLAGDLNAYKEVFEEIAPFSEISDVGSSVQFRFENPSVIEITLTIRGHDAIPTETYTLLQSGKLSTKKMPQGQFHDLYHDYICGCVLRVANETFALLPFETVIVTAVGDVLNTQTGHLEVKPLLSVVIPRTTLGKLELDAIDPSDSMQNFICRMNFKKNKGFMVVDKIDASTVG